MLTITYNGVKSPAIHDFNIRSFLDRVATDSAAKLLPFRREIKALKGKVELQFTGNIETKIAGDIVLKDIPEDLSEMIIDALI